MIAPTPLLANPRDNMIKNHIEASPEDETSRRMSEMKDKYWEDLDFLIREFTTLQERLTLEHQEFPPDTDAEFKSASRRTLIRMQYFLANVKGTMERISGKSTNKDIQSYNLHQLNLLERHIVDNILPVKERLLAQIAAAEANAEGGGSSSHFADAETCKAVMVKSEPETVAVKSEPQIQSNSQDSRIHGIAYNVSSQGENGTAEDGFCGDQFCVSYENSKEGLSHDDHIQMVEAFTNDNSTGGTEDISDLFTPLDFLEYGEDDKRNVPEVLVPLEFSTSIATSDSDQDDNLSALQHMLFEPPLDGGNFGKFQNANGNEGTFVVKEEMKIAMPHTVDVPGRMFLGKREFQWEEAENCNRSKKSSRNSLVPILTKEREVQYECSNCKENYFATMSCNPWWALVRHTCPRCNCLQAPRIDISLPANNVDHHDQILSACAEDSDCGGDTDGGYMSEEEMEDDLGVGVQLDPIQAAKLLVLMGHARDCTGCHADPRHAQVCHSTKFLMLHIRDCNGFAPTAGDSSERVRCPHSWCKPCRNLMFHLVKCPTPSICPICNPINLPKQLEQLRELNKLNRRVVPKIEYQEPAWPFDSSQSNNIDCFSNFSNIEHIIP